MSEWENKYTDAEWEDIVSNLFLIIGIPAGIKGFDILRQAIIETIKNPSIIRPIGKNLYPMLADMYNTTPKKIECRIRYAAAMSFNRGDRSVMHEIFGNTVKASYGHPSNTVFIAQVADFLRRRNR